MGEIEKCMDAKILVCYIKPLILCKWLIDFISIGIIAPLDLNPIPSTSFMRKFSSSLVKGQWFSPGIWYLPSSSLNWHSQNKWKNLDLDIKLLLLHSYVLGIYKYFSDILEKISFKFNFKHSLLILVYNIIF